MSWIPEGGDFWSEYGLYVVMAGVAAGLWVVREVRARLAQSWPTTEGIVESAEVRVEGVGRDRREIPEVSYSYRVEGEFYSGLHVVTKKKLTAFPKGSRVVVHYKPSDPTKSSLDREDVRSCADRFTPQGSLDA